MFDKIIIANRGEIACRVIRSARRMGIATVAVYSEADRDALHVELADEAVLIGPPPAAQSYLVAENIIAAARSTGAGALHPGYGFLAENAGFARALENNGIVFIGPPPGAIATMGDKVASKKLARGAGVNTIPGHAGVIDGPDRALEIARDIGYPVMIKAAAGGGGKGMRVARSDDEVEEGFRSAAREAKSSFGDDRIFIEKFITGPRHIEIQVLADSHGNCIHLGERDCSIQRRHQKVIEEAPSGFLDADTRAAMAAQAVALARAVDYHSVGTVEFIVDGAREFYFLEMNTRLQVEHPVTELVTGLDLVELMIRVAAGEALPLSQEDVQTNGWAIEARIYAEDPARGFLPSIGRLERFHAPPGDAGLRLDSGVVEGSQITVHYDPLIAKLCAHGDSREAAIEALGAGLDRTYIRGIEHNMTFLGAVLAHPRFRDGGFTTEFIGREFPDGFDGGIPDRDMAETLAAVAAFIHLRFKHRAAGSPASAADRWVVSLGGANFAVEVTAVPGGADIGRDDGTVAIRSAWRPGEPIFSGTIDGRDIGVVVERRASGYRLIHGGVGVMAAVQTPRELELAAFMPETRAADTSNALLCSMPGLVVAIEVEEGETVKNGQPLAVVEAMKMENILRAARDGEIGAIHARVGDTLAVDQIILEFGRAGDEVP